MSVCLKKKISYRNKAEQIVDILLGVQNRRLADIVLWADPLLCTQMTKTSRCSFSTPTEFRVKLVWGKLLINMFIIYIVYIK